VDAYWTLGRRAIGDAARVDRTISQLANGSFPNWGIAMRPQARELAPLLDDVFERPAEGDGYNDYRFRQSNGFRVSRGNQPRALRVPRLAGASGDRTINAPPYGGHEMHTAIEPLPDSLSDWTAKQLKDATEARKSRVQEIRQANGGTLEGVKDGEASEARGLLADLNRLGDESNKPNPNGFWMTHPSSGGRPSSPSEAGFGRIEGLGREFLHRLDRGPGGLQAALD
jgi:hypothetical protein